MKIHSPGKIGLNCQEMLRAAQQPGTMKEWGLTSRTEIEIEAAPSPDEANAAINGLSESALLANFSGAKVEIGKEAMKDPQVLSFLEHLGKAAEQNRKSLEKLNREEPDLFTVGIRTAGGATFGFAAGAGFGTALGIIKDVGQNSGSPALGSLALAFGVFGAALGGALGSELISKVEIPGLFTMERL